MLAVTNLGGLGTCARGPTKVRLSARGDHYVEPCPVKLVGRMEIHGKPGISWTRLSSTASAGSRFLHLEEAVDWEIDTDIVITPSDRHQDEVRKVADILDGGFTVELDRPLSFEHLGIWYHHEEIGQESKREVRASLEEIPTPTDLRAAVGRLTRNVKVQGDDASVELGSAYQFGVHVGAFVGGVMRIENTEITRSGQAANFGRYSSHWHVLSPHRTIDVADVAYLRNNSYHHTFQRAVVVHSSDFATVEHNVAYKTKGHSYFTEAGDEVFTLYNHNLAVRPLQHPLLLDDDMDPAGFWLPGFTGWHRNNLAAGCHRGWRVRKDREDLTFFNNSAHASGFGWHLKPPHAPPTLNVFQNFTAFRCDTGMFYYGTGNILHDDHRFIECGTGHFMNHLSNGLHTPPFYHNLVLVGNIAPEATTARSTPGSGLGIRGPKDNEYFYVSGLTVINYFESPVLRGCFETTCTMRFERATWWNSTQRTWSTPRQIFWDLDGSLTGYPNGFVSLDYEYNHFPGLCHHSDEHGNGLVCGAADGSVRVSNLSMVLRCRLLVDRQEPWQLDGKDMFVQTSAGSRMKRLRRNHFDATEGLRLDRMPSFEDPFGSHSMMLWPDECAEFNLTEDSAELCGVYVNETGEGLKEEIDEQPEVDMVHGRVTVSFSVQVIDTNGSYEPGPDTPTGQLRQEFIPRECPVLGCKRPGSADGDFNKIRRWSDPSGWPDGRLPEEMDNVVLPPEALATQGHGVLVQSIEHALPFGTQAPKDDARWEASANNVLHGKSWCPECAAIIWSTENYFHFGDPSNFHAKQAKVNATLHAHSVKVWGILEMGTVERPMPPTVKAEIVLWGDEQSITAIMVEGLFLVNKVVAVLGNVSAESPGAGGKSLCQEIKARGPLVLLWRSRTLLSLDEPVTHRHFAGVVDESMEGQALFRDVDFLGLGKHLYQAPALKFNFLGGHSNISRVENCVFSRSKSGAIEASSWNPTP
ncbi:PKHD1L1 [Symbiodinium sp. CCMP2456]|nr:PKHD1L1 [Symbiodinium sp. CCMP2456]